MQRIHIGPYFETMWGSSINLPICTKFFCFLVFFITMLDWTSSLFTDADLESSVFVLLPSSFLYRPWTLITFPLRERNPIVLAGTLLCVGANGKMFEPHWGRKEMAKFLALVNTLTGLAFSFFYLFLFSIEEASADLFQHVALGLGPTITAFSVCCKQAYPEYNVKLFGAFGFKLKQFPSILLAALTILAFIFSIFQDYLVLCWFSAIISWVYLRFFKVQDLIRGDRSETFSFVSFFPTILRPPVKVLSNTIFSFLVKLRLCQPIQSISTSDLESGNYYARVPPSERQTSPVSLADDAERRKALALKALDMRLKLAPPVDVSASSSQPGSSSAPNSSIHVPDI